MMDHLPVFNLLLMVVLMGLGQLFLISQVLRHLDRIDLRLAAIEDALWEGEPDPADEENDGSVIEFKRAS